MSARGAPRWITTGLSLLAGQGLQAAAPESTSRADSPLSEVQITATRVAEPIERLPATVTVVGGDSLRDRGAGDLRTALALVAGVDAPPGGDAGPASSVPSLWGLHEFDAFLLVVDGVPAGGAFNPALPTLDLHDVDRIEVMKGAAPVMYGATSFVGVIQVVRRAAGSSDQQALISAGGHDSWSGDVSLSLPAVGSFRESLLLDGQRMRLSDPRAGVDAGHVLYRSSAPVAGGTGTLDAEFTSQTQLPTSPVIREGMTLTTRTALDANFNPQDAGINEQRAHLTAGYTRAGAWGEWHTLLSYSRSTIHDLRGFVRPQLAIGADGNNADGFNQDRTLEDAYFDSYWRALLVPALDVVAGLDWLYGRGSQQSRNFAYVAPLDGAAPAPPSGARHIDEINELGNRRNFAGAYLQADWKPNDRVAVMAGARMNRTREDQVSSHVDTVDSANNLQAADTRSHTRGSGTIGVSYVAWGTQNSASHATVFADYRNTFKPAAIDFGPDFTPSILEPETARSYEAGLRLTTRSGRLKWNLEGFRLNFTDLVVHQLDVNGAPILANAGSQHFQGVETELRWWVTAAVLLSGSYSYHDTRFDRAVSVESGNTVRLDGHQLELAPHNLAAVGVQFTPPRGVQAAVQVAYVGRRFLDRLNSAPTGGYAAVDARLAYRFARYSLALNGYNLTDRREPVTMSEFGDQSYYLLPGRRLMLEASRAL